MWKKWKQILPPQVHETNLLVLFWKSYIFNIYLGQIKQKVFQYDKIEHGYSFIICFGYLGHVSIVLFCFA